MEYSQTFRCKIDPNTDQVTVVVTPGYIRLEFLFFDISENVHLRDENLTSFIDAIAYSYQNQDPWSLALSSGGRVEIYQDEFYAPDYNALSITTEAVIGSVFIAHSEWFEFVSLVRKAVQPIEVPEPEQGTTDASQPPKDQERVLLFNGSVESAPEWAGWILPVTGYATADAAAARKLAKDIVARAGLSARIQVEFIEGQVFQNLPEILQAFEETVSEERDKLRPRPKFIVLKTI